MRLVGENLERKWMTEMNDPASCFLTMHFTGVYYAYSGRLYGPVSLAGDLVPHTRGEHQ